MVGKYFVPYKYQRSEIPDRLYHSANSASIRIYEDQDMLYHNTLGRISNIARFRATELLKAIVPRQLVGAALERLKHNGH